MTQLSTPRLEAFARLIALGWPPVLAAKGAGFGIRRPSHNAERLANPAVRARIADLKAPRPEAVKGKPKAGAPDDTEDEDDEEGEARCLPPIMSEEEWMAEFAPHLLDDWRAKNKG